MSLALRQDVFFCRANNQIALLDLRADRYFSLPAVAIATFEKLARGDDLEDIEIRSLSPLIKANLLVPGDQHKVVQQEIVLPTHSLLDHSLPTSSIGKIVLAMVSQVKTTAILKMGTVCSAIHQIQAHKQEVLKSTPSGTEDIVIRAAADFLATRVFISTQDRCLPRSIALMHYLLGKSLPASLVVGVQMTPFIGHAWVQYGDMILNDRVDEVLPYTPIMVV